MEDIIKDLFYDHCFAKNQNYEHPTIADEIKGMEIHKKSLKKCLNKKQKKLLLRIIDATDRINEQINLDSYTRGFKAGLRVGYESNSESYRSQR